MPELPDPPKGHEWIQVALPVPAALATEETRRAVTEAAFDALAEAVDPSRRRRYCVCGLRSV